MPPVSASLCLGLAETEQGYFSVPASDNRLLDLEVQGLFNLLTIHVRNTCRGTFPPGKGFNFCLGSIRR